MATRRTASPPRTLDTTESVTEALTDILSGTATSEDFVVPGEGATDQQEDKDAIPFPGDKRHVREQVNDHPYVTIFLDFHREPGDHLVIDDFQYDWFDEVPKMKAWAKSLRTFAQDDVETHGDVMYVTVTAETGPVLNIMDITVHGVEDKDHVEAIAGHFKDNPESALFPARPAKAKPKSKQKAAVKGKVEASEKDPTPKAIRRPKASRPKASGSTEDIVPKGRTTRPTRSKAAEETTTEPVIRSRGFRAAKRQQGKVANQNQKAS